MKNDDPGLLTANDVAKLLNVSSQTVRKYAKGGLLQGYRIGGVGRPTWRFTRDQVKKFIEIGGQVNKKEKGT